MRRQALLAAALFFIYVIWESSYAAIQACLVEIPVFALTASRLLVSGVMLVVIARRSKEPRFTPREFLGAALVGIVLIWATSTALAIGLSDTDAGLASVIFATVVWTWRAAVRSTLQTTAMVWNHGGPNWATGDTANWRFIQPWFVVGFNSGGCSRSRIVARAFTAHPSRAPFGNLRSVSLCGPPRCLV
jgi:hypothetical protein